MRSTTEDLILWQHRIEERTKSGMSVSEWCIKNQISKSKYHYWKNKINKIERSANKIAFAEVTSIISSTVEQKSNPSKLDNFQIFFKDIQVTVPSNFSEDSLAGLMRVLVKL